MKMRITGMILCMISIGLVMLSLSSCSGGGGGGSDGGDDTSSGGWITIGGPTAEPMTTTNCNSIYLSGEAFISPSWSRCCSGSAEDTGVTVTWRNKTTGASGNADQIVDTCYFLGTPSLCDHQWSATIPLALGENQITVTASDPSGISGQDSIAVAKPVLTYSISGKVSNTSNTGLWNYGLSGFKLTLTDADPNTYVFTDTNGNYCFSCIQNGSYTISPSSTVNFTFTPTNRSVTVSNLDVANQDFMTEAHFISGTVSAMSGIGISGAQVSLAGTNSTATYYTDSNGYYIFAVPNGSFTITPSYCPLIECYSFTPASRNVNIDSEDVTGQNFVKQ